MSLLGFAGIDQGVFVGFGLETDAEILVNDELREFRWLDLFTLVGSLEGRGGRESVV